MYPVSEEFLEAIGDNHRKYDWSGYITTTGGIVYEFTNQDIVKGSSYILRQCSGNTEIELGTVYASELALSLFLDVDRYTLGGAEIKVFFTLILANGTEETIPMGVFEVVEANRHTKTIELKAYDYMLRFDEVVDTTEFEGWGEYNKIVQLCEAVGVGLATTEEEYKRLPGTSLGFELYEPNDITTYRDMLFYLCQMMGCVGQINRLGQLELLTHGTELVYSIPIEQRFSSSYSDYITRYSSITYQNMDSGETYTLKNIPDDGLNVDLGANPYLQATEDAGGDFTAGYRLRDVLNALAKLKYTPFTATTIGNPALDPMDVLNFSGGHADEEALSCLTHITYNIGGKQVLKCVGTNPKLATAKSNIQKVVDSVVGGGVGGSGDSGGSCDCIDQKIVYLHYTNYSAYTIDHNLKTIISKDFSTIYDTTVMFHATVGLTISGVEDTAEMTVIYKLNESWDVLADEWQQVKTVKNGNDFLSLFFCTSEITKETINQFKLLMSISTGTVSIEIKKIRATLYGQYLQEDDGYWDGTLNVEDSFWDIPILHDVFSVEEFTDSVAIEERLAGEKEEQYQFTTILGTIEILTHEMEVTSDV